MRHARFYNSKKGCNKGNNCTFSHERKSNAAVVREQDIPTLLQKQIRDRVVEREYLAIIHGVLKNRENNDNVVNKGVIDLPIGRHLIDRKKMAVMPSEKNGRKAVTYWKILERLGNYSMVNFKLGTGRTHQIRVHSSFLGCPILGDPLYSSNHSFNINLSGQALHAHKLSLIHPVSSNKIEITANPPIEFTKLLKTLRKKTTN